MSTLKVYDWSALDAAARRAALSRPAIRANPAVAERVRDLIAQVRHEGDLALLRLTAELDHADLSSLRVSEREVREAVQSLPSEARAAIDVAIANVRRFHSAQLGNPIRVETAAGVVCERVNRPIRAVGLYVPAGTAPLPSTAIMLSVPADLAGCPVRILCTPPGPDGCADPAIVAAASACGIRDIFKVGGAQAIAAMAYGTASIPKVDKIFGPGNAWVTAAKWAVASDPDGAALDMPAGPSEVMVIADQSANPRFVALDLLAQAEHGPDSHAVLICLERSLIDAVEKEIAAAMASLSRRRIIAESLGHGAAVLVRDMGEAVSAANEYAPEHLIIQARNPRALADVISTAGSVFLGPWTPESVGDYCSGTNHVLPTYGYSRAYSGLSVSDFQRRMTVQELTLDGLRGLAPTVTTLAAMEGLDAHSEAVRVRLACADEARR